MMIQWFEDKINHSIPPTEESLARLSQYATIYAQQGSVAASLACVLCRLVVECRVRGVRMYGALQRSCTEENKVYYLPNLPMTWYDYESLEEFIASEVERIEIASFGRKQTTCPNLSCQDEPLVLLTEPINYGSDSLQCPKCSYQLDRELTATSLKGIGWSLCAIFPLAKRLGVDPDHLLFVAIVVAELLMSRAEEEVQGADSQCWNRLGSGLDYRKEYKMGCVSDYQQHTEREAESGRVLEFLKEINGEPYNHDKPSYYGRVQTLNKDTAKLCETLGKLQTESPDEIKGFSLELQLWWKKHQEADRARELRESETKKQFSLREAILERLTEDEKRALGLKPLSS